MMNSDCSDYNESNLSKFRYLYLLWWIFYFKRQISNSLYTKTSK